MKRLVQISFLALAAFVGGCQSSGGAKETETPISDEMGALKDEALSTGDEVSTEIKEEADAGAEKAKAKVKSAKKKAKKKMSK